MKRRISTVAYTATAVLAASLLSVAMIQTVQTSRDDHEESLIALERDVGGFKRSLAQERDAGAEPTRFEVTVRKPEGPPRVKLVGTDPQGRQGEVACSTCHSVRTPNLSNSAEELNEFHQGMAFAHGKLGCYACHNAEDADSLRLAEGTSVSYPDVMTLCSQCHGPQAKAFENGAHGGMNGFWDLSRGPQTKNNCVDCHDPHVPAYPKMVVGFKPKDRFNAPAGDGDSTGESNGEH